MFPKQPTKYVDIREQLIKIGIHIEIVKFLDTLAPEVQEDISLLFQKMANDELLFILSLKELDFVKERIEAMDNNPLLH